jgi:hypothetical protein
MKKFLIGLGAVIGLVVIYFALLLLFGWALSSLVNYVFHTNYTTLQAAAFLVAVDIVARFAGFKNGGKTE